MKYYAYACLALWATACGSPQAPNSGYADAGFDPNPNGLLYSPQMIRQLRRTVDSLNLQAQNQKIVPAYRGAVQGRACQLWLTAGDLDAAYQALQDGITPEEFLRRFPAAELNPNQLVVATEEEREGYKGNKRVETIYRRIPFGADEQGSSLGMRLKGRQLKNRPGRGRWVSNYLDQPDYTHYLEAFFFPDGLSSPVLPARYARLVQYADCLVDTTTQIYLPSAKRTGGRFYPSGFSRSAQAFLDYAHQQTRQPTYDYDKTLPEGKAKDQWLTYMQGIRIWDSLRLRRMDELARNPEFRALLARAATDDSSRGTNDDEFEEYVARYYSPQKALQLKRSRRVVGNCSADEGPRRHALSIALLAAQTQHWPTFLRAHLDIMNDRFERNTDGSYAQARRHTYLRELEELNVNAPNLLLGISLEVSNGGRNHYRGDVVRLGRALAETASPRPLEQLLLTMLTDPHLDTYNRVRAYYLFLNYNYWLTDRVRQGKNLIRLNAAARQLPAYLSNQLAARSRAFAAAEF